MNGKIFDWKKAGDPEHEVFLYDQRRDEYANGRAGQNPLYRGRVSHYEERLADGNVSVLLRDSRIQDAGTYTCTIPPLNGFQCKVELVVGAVLQPRTKALEPTDAGWPLQCFVGGADPRPAVEWQGPGGKPLAPSRDSQVVRVGERYEVTAWAVATEPGNYTCVAKQEALHHVISDTIELYAVGPFGERPRDPWVISAMVGGACLVVGFLIGFVVKGRVSPPRQIPTAGL